MVTKNKKQIDKRLASILNTIKVCKYGNNFSYSAEVFSEEERDYFTEKLEYLGYKVESREENKLIKLPRGKEISANKVYLDVSWI